MICGWFWAKTSHTLSDIRGLFYIVWKENYTTPLNLHTLFLLKLIDVMFSFLLFCSYPSIIWRDNYNL